MASSTLLRVIANNFNQGSNQTDSLSSLVTTLLRQHATMERVNFNYSMKNIPLPSKTAYLKTMISKLESLIKRMRWKAYFFDQKTENKCTNNTFGFKSPNSPPQNQHLNAFEHDLYDMVRNTEFKYTPNKFQQQLRNDTKLIRQNDRVIVPADKTNNMYKISVSEYNKLLTENITKSYKKAESSTMKSINKEAKSIATDLGISDRVEQYQQHSSFITMKDHKENFENNTKCRLINPAKSEIGIVSKSYLDSINNSIRDRIHVNQWRSTAETISWFTKLEEKNNRKFIKFDIADFYPSISQSLLSKSIQFAKSLHVDVSDTAVSTIMHARKSLLFNETDIWVKSQNEEFDVTMGSYDGAEICELVGLYLLNELSKHFEKDDIGLYRDDGLCCFRNLSGPQMDKVKKEITKIFKDNDLDITTECNLTITDFLDVTLDLRNNKYYPFRKPNSDPLYINAKSNHPPSIIKQIPDMIGQRISENSCSIEEFNKAAPVYNKALANSGFVEKIVYTPSSNKKKRSRKRNIIWFNPPFNANVKTNIGKLFLNLLEKHFPRHHRFHKLFNRSKVKLSYSCMPNMASILRRNNVRILSNPATTIVERTCNCKQNDICPLAGECLKSGIVYKALVKTSDNEISYLGTSEGTFKQRLYNHTKSFRNQQYEKDTELSKHVWKLKESNTPFKINWSIAASAAPYTSGSKKCDLCLTEKLLIATSDPKTILNKRDEIMSKCRHMNKFKLKCFKT